MNKQTKNLIFSVIGVILLITIVFGATFAYLNASTNSVNNIKGSTYDFDVNLTINNVKNNGLVPVMDNLIITSLNSTNSCVSSDGYGLCSIYEITLSNTGASQNLTGSIKTNAGTTYTTNHLKYQLYTLSGSTYTAVTDASNLSYVIDSTNPFTSSNNNLFIQLNKNQNKTYYLVVWLSDVSVNQIEDADKKYYGTLEFVSTDGDSLTAQFNT